MNLMLTIMVVAVLVLAALLLLGGWIAPLTIGLVWRSRGRPGARAWLLFASAWGLIAILLVAGFFGAQAFLLRSSGGFGGERSSASTFDAARYRSATATLKTAFQGEAELLAYTEQHKLLRFTTTNGLFTVPAGDLVLQSYRAIARDAQKRKWTAANHFEGQTKVTPPPGGTQELEVGPPLTVSVEITASAASDRISLAPVYVDRAGRTCALESTPRCENPPQFQFIDPAGNVAWSDKFEFG